MFSVRIVTVNHYIGAPVPGLDVVFSEFRNSKVTQVPVLRIFGATPAGQKTCLHVHGVFPYFYVPCEESEVSDKFLQQLALSIDTALQVSTGNAGKYAQHVFKISPVSGRQLYGYRSTERQFLKIYFYNPYVIKRAADLLLSGAVLNRVFQPFESHVPFNLQFFIDYNLYGMNLLNLAAVKFRKSPGEGNASGDDVVTGKSPADESLMYNSVCTQHWAPSDIPGSQWLPDEVKRQSICELEVDGVATDILNRLDLKDNVDTNPGLIAIWEDERQRREQLDQLAEMVPPPSPERGRILPQESERDWLERLQEVVDEQLRDLREHMPTPEGYYEEVPAPSASQQSTNQPEDHLSQQTASQRMEVEVEPVINEDLVMSQVMSQVITSESQAADKELAKLLLNLGEDDDSILSTQTPATQGDNNDGEDDPVALEREESREMSQVWLEDTEEEGGANSSRDEMLIPEIDETSALVESDSEMSALPQLDGQNDAIPQKRRKKSKLQMVQEFRAKRAFHQNSSISAAVTPLSPTNSKPSKDYDAVQSMIGRVLVAPKVISHLNAQTDCPTVKGLLTRPRQTARVQLPNKGGPSENSDVFVAEARLHSLKSSPHQFERPKIGGSGFADRSREPIPTSHTNKTLSKRREGLKGEKTPGGVRILSPVGKSPNHERNSYNQGNVTIVNGSATLESAHQQKAKGMQQPGGLPRNHKQAGVTAEINKSTASDVGYVKKGIEKNMKKGEVVRFTQLKEKLTATKTCSKPLSRVKRLDFSTTNNSTKLTFQNDATTPNVRCFSGASGFGTKLLTVETEINVRGPGGKPRPKVKQSFEAALSSSDNWNPRNSIGSSKSFRRSISAEGKEKAEKEQSSIKKTQQTNNSHQVMIMEPPSSDSGNKPKKKDFIPESPISSQSKSYGNDHAEKLRALDSIIHGKERQGQSSRHEERKVKPLLLRKKVKPLPIPKRKKTVLKIVRSSSAGKELSPDGGRSSRSELSSDEPINISKKKKRKPTKKASQTSPTSQETVKCSLNDSSLESVNSDALFSDSFDTVDVHAEDVSAKFNKEQSPKFPETKTQHTIQKSHSTEVLFSKRKKTKKSPLMSSDPMSKPLVDQSVCIKKGNGSKKASPKSGRSSGGCTSPMFPKSKSSMKQSKPVKVKKGNSKRASFVKGKISRTFPVNLVFKDLVKALELEKNKLKTLKTDGKPKFRYTGYPPLKRARIRLQKLDLKKSSWQLTKEWLESSGSVGPHLQEMGKITAEMINQCSTEGKSGGKVAQCSKEENLTQFPAIDWLKELARKVNYDEVPRHAEMLGHLTNDHRLGMVQTAGSSEHIVTEIQGKVDTDSRWRNPEGTKVNSEGNVGYGERDHHIENTEIDKIHDIDMGIIENITIPLVEETVENSTIGEDVPMIDKESGVLEQNCHHVEHPREIGEPSETVVEVIERTEKSIQNKPKGSEATVTAPVAQEGSDPVGGLSVAGKNYILSQIAEHLEKCPLNSLQESNLSGAGLGETSHEVQQPQESVEGSSGVWSLGEEGVTRGLQLIKDRDAVETTGQPAGGESVRHDDDQNHKRKEAVGKDTKALQKSVDIGSRGEEVGEDGPEPVKDDTVDTAGQSAGGESVKYDDVQDHERKEDGAIVAAVGEDMETFQESADIGSQGEEVEADGLELVQDGGNVDTEGQSAGRKSVKHEDDDQNNTMEGAGRIEADRETLQKSDECVKVAKDGSTCEVLFEKENVLTEESGEKNIKEKNSGKSVNGMESKAINPDGNSLEIVNDVSSQENGAANYEISSTPHSIVSSDKDTNKYLQEMDDVQESKGEEKDGKVQNDTRKPQFVEKERQWGIDTHNTTERLQEVDLPDIKEKYAGELGENIAENEFIDTIAESDDSNDNCKEEVNNIIEDGAFRQTCHEKKDEVEEMTEEGIFKETVVKHDAKVPENQEKQLDTETGIENDAKCPKPDQDKSNCNKVDKMVENLEQSFHKDGTCGPEEMVQKNFRGLDPVDKPEKEVNDKSIEMERPNDGHGIDKGSGGTKTEESAEKASKSEEETDMAKSPESSNNQVKNTEFQRVEFEQKEQRSPGTVDKVGNPTIPILEKGMTENQTFEAEQTLDKPKDNPTGAETEDPKGVCGIENYAEINAGKQDIESGQKTLDTTDEVKEVDKITEYSRKTEQHETKGTAAVEEGEMVVSVPDHVSESEIEVDHGEEKDSRSPEFLVSVSESKESDQKAMKDPKENKAQNFGGILIQKEDPQPKDRTPVESENGVGSSATHAKNMCVPDGEEVTKEIVDTSDEEENLVIDETVDNVVLSDKSASGISSVTKCNVKESHSPELSIAAEKEPASPNRQKGPTGTARNSSGSSSSSSKDAISADAGKSHKKKKKKSKKERKTLGARSTMSDMISLKTPGTHGVHKKRKKHKKEKGKGVKNELKFTPSSSLSDKNSDARVNEEMAVIRTKNFLKANDSTLKESQTSLNISEVTKSTPKGSNNIKKPVLLQGHPIDLTKYPIEKLMKLPEISPKIILYRFKSVDSSSPKVKAKVEQPAPKESKEQLVQGHKMETPQMKDHATSSPSSGQDSKHCTPIHNQTAPVKRYTSRKRKVHDYAILAGVHQNFQRLKSGSKGGGSKSSRDADLSSLSSLDMGEDGSESGSLFSSDDNRESDTSFLGKKSLPLTPTNVSKANQVSKSLKKRKGSKLSGSSPSVKPELVFLVNPPEIVKDCSQQSPQDKPTFTKKGQGRPRKIIVDNGVAQESRKPGMLCVNEKTSASSKTATVVDLQGDTLAGNAYSTSEKTTTKEVSTVEVSGKQKDQDTDGPQTDNATSGENDDVSVASSSGKRETYEKTEERCEGLREDVDTAASGERNDIHVIKVTQDVTTDAATDNSQISLKDKNDDGTKEISGNASKGNHMTKEVGLEKPLGSKEESVKGDTELVPISTLGNKTEVINTTSLVDKLPILPGLKDEELQLLSQSSFHDALWNLAYPSPVPPSPRSSPPKLASPTDDLDQMDDEPAAGKLVQEIVLPRVLKCSSKDELMSSVGRDKDIPDEGSGASKEGWISDEKKAGTLSEMEEVSGTSVRDLFEELAGVTLGTVGVPDANEGGEDICVETDNQSLWKAPETKSAGKHTAGVPVANVEIGKELLVESCIEKVDKGVDSAPLAARESNIQENILENLQEKADENCNHEHDADRNESEKIICDVTAQPENAASQKDDCQVLCGTTGNGSLVNVKTASVLNEVDTGMVDDKEPVSLTENKRNIQKLTSSGDVCVRQQSNGEDQESLIPRGSPEVFSNSSNSPSPSPKLSDVLSPETITYANLGRKEVMHEGTNAGRGNQVVQKLESDNQLTCSENGLNKTESVGNKSPIIEYIGSPTEYADRSSIMSREQLSDRFKAVLNDEAQVMQPGIDATSGVVEKKSKSDGNVGINVPQCSSSDADTNLTKPLANRANPLPAVDSVFQETMVREDPAVTLEESSAKAQNILPENEDIIDEATKNSEQNDLQAVIETILDKDDDKSRKSPVLDFQGTSSQILRLQSNFMVNSPGECERAAASISDLGDHFGTEATSGSTIEEIDINTSQGDHPHADASCVPESSTENETQMKGEKLSDTLGEPILPTENWVEDDQVIHFVESEEDSEGIDCLSGELGNGIRITTGGIQSVFVNTEMSIPIHVPSKLTEPNQKYPQTHTAVPMAQSGRQEMDIKPRIRPALDFDMIEHSQFHLSDCSEHETIDHHEMPGFEADSSIGLLDSIASEVDSTDDLVEQEGDKFEDEKEKAGTKRKKKHKKEKDQRKGKDKKKRRKLEKERSPRKRKREESSESSEPPEPEKQQLPPIRMVFRKVKKSTGQGREDLGDSSSQETEDLRKLQNLQKAQTEGNNEKSPENKTKSKPKTPPKKSKAPSKNESTVRSETSHSKTDGTPSVQTFVDTERTKSSVPEIPTSNATSESNVMPLTGITNRQEHPASIESYYKYLQSHQGDPEIKELLTMSARFPLMNPTSVPGQRMPPQELLHRSAAQASSPHNVGARNMSFGSVCDKAVGPPSCQATPNSLSSIATVPREDVPMGQSAQGFQGIPYVNLAGDPAKGIPSFPEFVQNLRSGRLPLPASPPLVDNAQRKVNIEKGPSSGQGISFCQDPYASANPSVSSMPRNSPGSIVIPESLHSPAKSAQSPACLASRRKDSEHWEDIVIDLTKKNQEIISPSKRQRLNTMENEVIEALMDLSDGPWDGLDQHSKGSELQRISPAVGPTNYGFHQQGIPAAIQNGVPVAQQKVQTEQKGRETYMAYPGQRFSSNLPQNQVFQVSQKGSEAYPVYSGQMIPNNFSHQQGVSVAQQSVSIAQQSAAVQQVHLGQVSHRQGVPVMQKAVSVMQQDIPLRQQSGVPVMQQCRFPMIQQQGVPVMQQDVSLAQQSVLAPQQRGQLSQRGSEARMMYPSGNVSRQQGVSVAQQNVPVAQQSVVMTQHGVVAHQRSEMNFGQEYSRHMSHQQGVPVAQQSVSGAQQMSKAQPVNLGQGSWGQVTQQYVPTTAQDIPQQGSEAQQIYFGQGYSRNTSYQNVVPFSQQSVPVASQSLGTQPGNFGEGSSRHLLHQQGFTSTQQNFPSTLQSVAVAHQRSEAQNMTGVSLRQNSHQQGVALAHQSIPIAQQNFPRTEQGIPGLQQRSVPLVHQRASLAQHGSIAQLAYSGQGSTSIQSKKKGTPINLMGSGTHNINPILDSSRGAESVVDSFAGNIIEHGGHSINIKDVRSVSAQLHQKDRHCDGMSGESKQEGRMTINTEANNICKQHDGATALCDSSSLVGATTLLPGQYGQSKEDKSTVECLIETDKGSAKSSTGTEQSCREDVDHGNNAKKLPDLPSNQETIQSGSHSKGDKAEDSDIDGDHAMMREKGGQNGNILGEIVVPQISGSTSPEGNKLDNEGSVTRGVEQEKKGGKKVEDIARFLSEKNKLPKEVPSQSGSLRVDSRAAMATDARAKQTDASSVDVDKCQNEGQSKAKDCPSRERRSSQQSAEDDKAPARRNAFVPVRPPPTRAEIQQSLSVNGLTDYVHRAPYWEKSRDVPTFTREMANMQVQLNQNLPAGLKEASPPSSATGLGHWRTLMFVSDQSETLSFQDRLVPSEEGRVVMRALLESTSSKREVILTPSRLPPTRIEVTRWLQTEHDAKLKRGGGDRNAVLQKSIKDMQGKHSGKSAVGGDSKKMELAKDPGSSHPSTNRQSADKPSSQANYAIGGDAPPSPFLPDMIDQIEPSTPPVSPTSPLSEDTQEALPCHSTPLVLGRKQRPLQPAGLTPILVTSGRKMEGKLKRRVSLVDAPGCSAPKAVTPGQASSVTPLVKKGSFVSQLEGASLKNTCGFKYSQSNLQDAKALHENQNLTLMSLELHIHTRGKLRPDPEFDPIRAVFFCIASENYGEGVGDGASSEHVGVITVNNPNKNQLHNVSLLSSPKPFLSTYGLPNVEVTNVESEQAMFEEVVRLIRKHDPDFFIGYEIQQFSWGYLLDRAAALDVKMCANISRLPENEKESHFSSDKDAYGSSHTSEVNIAGRIVLNVWRLLRHEIALNTYTFENVAYHVLHQRVPLFSLQDLSAWFDHQTHLLRWRVVEHYMFRVMGNLKILKQMDLIGRTSELARLFGIQFFSVLSRGTQYRVESMMLRQAKAQNYVAISPSVQQRAVMKAPECIALVMEPESRLYEDPVIVLDFQSLYPSMMIGYNYCFSTCLGRVEHIAKGGHFVLGCTTHYIPPLQIKKLMDSGSLHVSPNGVVFVKKTVRHGILPRMLDQILNTRIMVKKGLKDHKEDKVLQRMLDNRQLGLKLIANVTYGYTSASFSGRMPCIEVGDSIVMKARETLERSIHLVESTPKWGARVVYGDTDSMFVMVKGASKERAFEVGKEIVAAVSKVNPKPVKLKLEKVYKPCVLQAKKRYVGYMYETPDQKEPKIDAKGIETIRRDSCPAVSKILEKALKIVFTTQNVSQVKRYVQKQFQKIIDGRINLQDLVFAKEYRGRETYKPGACVPALELTKRSLAVDKRSEPRVGERVPYVIVNGVPGLPLIQLVRRPEEMISDPSLIINSTYYITRQIVPALNRVFGIMGVETLQWYEELPRNVRVQASASNQPNPAKKGTISQYFCSLNCVICDQLTKTGLCEDCRRQPQLVTAVLGRRIQDYQRAWVHLTKVCRSCTGFPEHEPSCISNDCPIRHQLTKTQRKMNSIPQLVQLIDEMPTT